MTNAEKQALKAFAEAYLATSKKWQWRDEGNDLAEAVLALLADQEGRGELLEACPSCRSFEIRRTPSNVQWHCLSCDGRFTMPDFYQEVAPTQEPKP